jgi:hypothetical protein
MKSENLNFLELSGPLQASNRTALPLPISYEYFGDMFMNYVTGWFILMRIFEVNSLHPFEAVSYSLGLKCRRLESILLHANYQSSVKIRNLISFRFITFFSIKP